MNLMEESLQKKGEKKQKRASTIILILIFIIIIAIIAIIVYMAQIKDTGLKIYMNGSLNQKMKDVLLIEEDGTLYAQIKGIASYFEYESYNGDYAEKSEDRSKCYVQNQDEVANFELGSKKIYKLDLTKSNNNYEYFYTKNPVKSHNGELYADSDIIGKAFNASIEYDQEKNTINILTMPYLVNAYSPIVLDMGYKEISDVFANKKAILNDMLVVKKDNNIMGVIKASTKEAILEAKYSNITYLPNIGDFLVETNKKVGILSNIGKTKIRIIYDAIELMDSDAGLYLVKQDNKYGVLGLGGDLKIDINNNEIGIDISKFEKNDIKNKYIIAEKLIPVKKDNYWGLYDINGNQIVDFVYDSFGYISASKNNLYSLLVIPNYNAIVACKDKKYTLLDSIGNALFAPIADDIYMTIEGNEKKYYINANDNPRSAIEFLESRGITVKNTNNTSNKEQSKEVQNTINTVNNQKNRENQFDERNDNILNENIQEYNNDDNQENENED